MSKFTRFALIAGLGAMTAACGSGGLLNRDRPDEFAVQRQAPLVVPPDFNLVPPQPGAPRPAEGSAAAQTLEALFGGPQARSSVETSVYQSVRRPARERGLSIAFKNIADATNGMNEWSVKILVNLISKFTHARFNHIRMGVEIIVPHMFQNHGF